MFQKISDALLSVIYPQACHICEKSVESSLDGVACPSCWEKTRIFCGEETLCCKCSKFLSANSTEFETFCHACDEDFYDSARAIGIYENALSASVLHLKKEPFVPQKLQNLLVAAFDSSPFYDTDLIIPVPLSKRRLFERGFNQAALLTKVLEKKVGIKSDEKSLVRVNHSPIHRAAMDRKAREETVKNAFEVKRPRFVEAKKILLVDDVFTSGSTVSNCAKTLKENGASAVYVLTLARAL